MHSYNCLSINKVIQVFVKFIEGGEASINKLIQVFVKFIEGGEAPPKLYAVLSWLALTVCHHPHQRTYFVLSVVRECLKLQMSDL